MNVTCFRLSWAPYAVGAATVCVSGRQVVIDRFNRLRDEHSGSAFMSEAQREWVETRKLMLQAKPVAEDTAPNNPVRLRCFLVVKHRHFEMFIMFAILLNVAVSSCATQPNHRHACFAIGPPATLTACRPGYLLP